MCLKVHSLVLCMTFVVYECSDIFHEKSKITFYPDSLSEYFGYTVVLRNNSLLVGAPKAMSRTKKGVSPGLAFSCPLNNLNLGDVTCFPLRMYDEGNGKSVRQLVIVDDFYRSDMWFGATMATVPNGKILVCAPRWADPYKDKHLLANGACYIESQSRGLTLTPLKDQYRLAFRTDGMRKEYGEYGTHLNFYAYGQAGMSMKITENNSIIIGAPGLLQWTGGIIDYKFIGDSNSVFLNKQPITNPYFTKDLGPDDYFGYSVESGIFESNGKTLYVAGAPRSKMGYGQVLIFEPAIREMDPLNIRAKVRGPQLGSYFGATLCCTDIDGDGRSDLLVGAPNFVKKDGGLPYDQGAVFVYLANQKPELSLESAGYIVGSSESGARFGSSIANLGDIDGDGFKDIAIGAPWENNGLGAVYIYRGSTNGLNTKYTQRILAENAKSFGLSISQGFDVDGNNCNDLAIGAIGSDTAYLYRSIPTIQAHAKIKVPDAMNLPQNATNFTALFCVHVPPKKSWPHVKIDLKATITIDPEENRAMISGDSIYPITAKPGYDVCDEQVVEVKPTADLSKPISINLDLKLIDLEESTTFQQSAARLSEESTLHSSFLIQLVRDCGEDLVCTPWLVMSLELYNSTFVPGTADLLGARLTILNKEEPAYGAKVYITLPLAPKRVPSDCSLEALNMTCNVPAPLLRDEVVEWDIELEYVLKDAADKKFVIIAELDDPLYRRNISDEVLKEVYIDVHLMANLTVSGKALPNATLAITRDKLYEAGNVSFIHSYEVTNFGPSDWPLLEVRIRIPENVTLSNPIKGCQEAKYEILCFWPIASKVSLPVTVPLKFDLAKHAQLLEDMKLNVTSIVTITLDNGLWSETVVTTVLVLDPAPSIWPYVVGSIAGLLLLSAIIYGLYRYGFFSRASRDELKRLQEGTEALSISDGPSSSTRPPSIEADESTLELLNDDSD